MARSAHRPLPRKPALISPRVITPSPSASCAQSCQSAWAKKQPRCCAHQRSEEKVGSARPREIRHRCPRRNIRDRASRRRHGRAVPHNPRLQPRKRSAHATHVKQTATRFEQPAMAAHDRPALEGGSASAGSGRLPVTFSEVVSGVGGSAAPACRRSSRRHTALSVPSALKRRESSATCFSMSFESRSPITSSIPGQQTPSVSMLNKRQGQRVAHSRSAGRPSWPAPPASALPPPSASPPPAPPAG